MTLVIIFVIAILLGGFLLYRIETVAKRLEEVATKREEEAKQTAEDRRLAEVDRKLTHELLTTVKGWAIVMERHDAAKDKKLQEVAITAEKTKEELKQAINIAVDSVSEAAAVKTVQKLDERAASDSGSGSQVVRPALGGT